MRFRHRLLSMLLIMTMVISLYGNAFPGSGIPFISEIYAAGEDPDGNVVMSEDEADNSAEKAAQSEKNNGSDEISVSSKNDDAETDDDAGNQSETVDADESAETAESAESISGEGSNDEDTDYRENSGNASQNDVSGSGSQDSQGSHENNAQTGRDDYYYENQSDDESVNSQDQYVVPQDTAEFEQTLPVLMEEIQLYDEKGNPLVSTARVNEIWNKVFGRIPLTALNRDPEYVFTPDNLVDNLLVSVTGSFAPGVTARAGIILYSEEELYSETALASIDLYLYDANGNPYIPQGPVTIELGGRMIKNAVKKEMPLLIYSCEDNPVRTEKTKEYSADVLVYRDGFGEDERIRYSLNEEKDSIIFLEDLEGLRVYEDNTADFVAQTLPHHLILSQQVTERTLRAGAKGTDTKVEVSGALSGSTSASVSQADAAGYKLEADTDGSGLLAVDISLESERTASGKKEEFLPDLPVTVKITDDTIGEALSDNGELEVWQVSGDKSPEKIEDAQFNDNSVEFISQGPMSYVIVQTKLEKTLEASDGKVYRITVSYDQNAGIPADAELAVSEIKKGTPEYDEYVKESVQKLGKSAEEVSFAKFFDITLRDPETGTEYQPNQNVNATIELLDTELKEDTQVDVLHFGDEVEQMDCTVNGEAVTFEANGFSVYAIVSTVLKHTLTASDGNEYLVTVTFDHASGIPSDAELYVSEIKEGDAGYDKYVKKTASALGEKPENLAFARPFDITLKKPGTGEVCQPNENVQVRIELLNEKLDQYNEVNVIHFPRQADDAVIVDAAVQGKKVEFETDGFSVYVLAGVYTYTYTFYAPSGPVNEIITETGFSVENWSSCYDQISVKTDAGTAFTQTVKNGETPVVPQLPDTVDQSFIGWFEGSYEGTNVSFGRTAYDFNHVDIKENRAINLYARFSTPVSLVFHDQYNNDLKNYPVMLRRSGELINGSADVRVDNVKATYMGSEKLAFYGWSETPVQTPGDTAELISPDASGCLTITEEKHLYPVFQPVHWLSFYSGPEHSGASYIPTTYVFDNDGAEAPLPIATREGYTFMGWYVGVLNGDTVTYSDQITDANGAFIPGFSGDGYRLSGGKLLLSRDLTIYAKWEENHTADYRIVIWTQNPSDEAGLPDALKSYDFAESIKLTGSTGQMADADGYKDRTYEGYSYSRCDDAREILADGSTVLNVYYDLDSYTPSGTTHTLSYKDSVTSGKSAELPRTKEYAFNDKIDSFIPESGRKGYSFKGWFYDEDCTIPASLYVMPDKDVTVYAGWQSIAYQVIIDPNYGEFPEGSTDAMWFSVRIDEDPIQEYLDVIRNYVESSSGTYFYMKHDLAYYGGNAPSGVPRNEAKYVTDPGLATKDTTFEYAPGVYTFAGWYEVHADGTETLYDFTKHVDHNTTLRLHWKKSGTYYVEYTPGNGTLSGNQDENVYADQSGVPISCGANAPTGYTFEGWQVRGDESGRTYRVGDTFTLNADCSVIVSGKNTVYLDAVYSKAETAKIIYDPNGGMIASDIADIDFGSVESGAPTPVKAISDGKAVISNLVNNSVFTLSDGSGFVRNGMTLAGWSPSDDYQPGDDLFEPGGEYGVDSKEPVTLYAVWQVTVIYHLNSSSTTAAWGGDWGDDGYTYNESEKTYSRNIYLNQTVPEPSHKPSDEDSGKAFRYWATDSNGSFAFDFSKAVAAEMLDASTNHLELYAYWTEGISVPVHAVDASEETLDEKTENDGWTITHISVGASKVELTADSNVNPPAGSDYEFAFAAAGENLDSISEENAVSDVFYNNSQKQIYVTYQDGSKAPLGDQEIYFVYYLKKDLGILYRRMDQQGALSGVEVASDAPTKAADLGSFNMSDTVEQPKNWAVDSMLTHYSFAVGDRSATNEGDLHIITPASSTDDDRPALQIKNSWRGFRFSTDGSTWLSCGYDPSLYVIYYDQKPTVVTIKEQTLGSSAAMNRQFKYQFAVQETVTDRTDPDNPVSTVSDVFSETYWLPDHEGQTVQSAILFHSVSGVIETTQTITVTQEAVNGFDTSIDSGGKGTVTEAERKWTYTTGSDVETPTVVFTNTQSDQFVEVHIARVDTESSSIIADDSMRSSDHSFRIKPGENKDILTELTSDTVFSGDKSLYAFGTLLYGSADGSNNVTADYSDISSVSFEKGDGNVYELVLKDSDQKTLTTLDGGNIYYLYYPMPQVRYVKESPDGSLNPIKGSLNGESDSDTITYDLRTLTMNGVTVEQSQRFSISRTGFSISQETGGSNTFKMPPILDDGVYARYLSYSKLGIANTDNAASISALGNDHVSDKLTAYMRVQNNELQWSFTGEKNDWHTFSGTPTVYAIYEERGYDLQITKAVPIDVGSDPSFTITIESPAITKNNYVIEGYSGTAEINPARGSNPGTIRLDVSDGTNIKIKSLGHGSYTVSETGDDNYILTAKCVPLNGTPEDVAVTNSRLNFTLDREKRLELTNTHKAICKITDNGTEHPFYTLQSAVEYVEDQLSSATPVHIQMLTDYLMPASDVPVIPAGYTIVLDTADTSGGSYNFDGGKTGTSSGATITRAADFTSGPMLTNRGTLSLENLTIEGNNVAADSAMILNLGNVSVTTGTLIQNARNAAGNGGAICSNAGTVTVAATIRNSTALLGGAIYSEGSSIDITGTLSGNSAQDGGAIYYKGTGKVNISQNATLSSNTASTGNGGAIYATAGTIAVTGGSLSKNSASAGNGGAVYTVNGAVNVSGGQIGGAGNANTAVNGSAVFIESGSAEFSGGSVTGNSATDGGAVGVGGTNVKLYFSGTPGITGNTMNGAASNIYLDQDTDQIINAAGLSDGAEIGIFVSGDMTADLFENRGVPGAKFGVYSNDAGITAFKNDRLTGITVTADTASRRLVWGMALNLQVRYLDKYSTNAGFPQKLNNAWNGTKSYPTSSDWAEYYLPAGENPASAIGDDILSKKYFTSTTATFAYAFLDDGSETIEFGDYITDVNWDSTAGAWQFIKRDGTISSGGKLVVYFSEPAYINIENNTGFALNIGTLSLINHPAVNDASQAGYGYIYAVNGAVQDILEPITASDLQLAVGKSVKLLFPGGLTSQTYTLGGSFAVGDDTTTEIPVKQTGVADRVLTGSDRTNFTLSSGKTGSKTGSTVDVIFGGKRPICKIVVPTALNNVTIGPEGDAVGTDVEENQGKTAYLFSSLSQAVTFAQKFDLNNSAIELLVDYLIPGSDLVSIPAGLNLTFTTAIGDTTEDYNYSADNSARATISRDTDNTSSFIVVTNGTNTTSLMVENLVFDGKNFAGSIDGGVIKTKNCAVTVENCEFHNCVANNGGGIYVEFDTAASNADSAILSVTGCNFNNCQSKSSSSRQGGGAIWTNACNFTLTGEKDTNGNYTSGIFDSCTSFDQGGAVFHRIDWVYAEDYRKKSKSTVTACKFINCQAKAAGGLELDSYDIEVSDCWIENCQALNRNAGGFNVYIQYRPINNNDDPHPPVSATGETKLTLSNSVIKDCTANQAGGGFRTLTHKTTLIDCTFTNDTAGTGDNGGGISITNKNTTEAVIKGCTVQNCSAKNGGGIFFDGSTNTSAKLSIEDNPESHRESLISGNIATGQGGGVYTNSATTLINTKIQNNTISKSTVNDAAGMYINNKTLTIGKKGADEDVTIITGNTASGGVASNLHLWGGNNADSIVVNCDLSVGSHIGVTNPGTVTQQFGTSPNSTISPFWRPYGLADPTPDDPDYFPTFVADDGSVYGIIDRSDENGKRIIWGGPPVCKITDADGNLLYLDNAKKYPAIFDALEGGTAGNWTSAFSVLGVANPTLYTGTESSYTTKKYKVQMLVEEYQLGNIAKTYTVQPNESSLDITLTTASTSDDSYPYRGTPGSKATIVRKSGFRNSMFSVGTKLTFTDIILDGGSAKGRSSTVNGSVINITGSWYSNAVLGENAIIRDSTTTGEGTVYVDWGDFTLAGGTIENCTAKNGGAVYMKSRRQTTPDRGFFRITGGTIQNCTATEDGGGIYVKTGTFVMTGGKIQNCTAGKNGGGICFMADGQTPTTNDFTLSDGAIISNCKAATGGGVFVNNGKTMKMESAFIMGNSATTKGGGIAVGGNNVNLIFSKTPWVSGNTRTGSVADGNVCNLELDYYKDTIIQTNGIWNGARIGVYVPGTRDDDAPVNETNPYKDHGGEGDRFGTFNNLADASYLYGFVNDRNGLKGGLKSGTDPNSYKGIHWIKIFSLEVNKAVSGQQTDPDEEFAFKVTLTGIASDKTVAESINSTVDEPEKYGGLFFVNGVATRMVINDGSSSQIVPLKLKAGQSVTGERLPPGLNYTVEELLTNDQKEVYSPTPDEKIYGYIGEYAESTTRNRYLSTAEFTNLRPVCKITSGDTGAMLYYKTSIAYNWNDNGSYVVKQYEQYLPAVYATLEEAFTVINEGTPDLYFEGNGSHYKYTENNYRIEMLTNYAMLSSETVSSGKQITLKTAGTSDALFPYKGSGFAVVSRGDFNAESMFTAQAQGSLILNNITLDGRKNTYSDVTADGGIVKVLRDGELTIETGSILRNSTTTQNGGAVFAESGSGINVTGGTINLNSVTGSGNGAGIYLSQGAELKLKGDPSFGGTGVYNDGSINLTTGNIQNGTARQDIYIAGYASQDEEDTSAASLVVNGDITSGSGSIWVWAAESPHYLMLRQFAKIQTGISIKEGTCNVFRNAQDDSVTRNDTGAYLHGTLEGPVEGNIYWNGLTGRRKVILRKVTNVYGSLSGAVFTIYKGTSTDPYTAVNRETGETETLQNLESQSSGVYWIGILPYGTYDIHETTVPSSVLQNGTEGWWYRLTVDENGASSSEQMPTRPSS